MRSGRGVGFCINPTCEDYTRGRVLGAGATSYVCRRCHWVGKVEQERGQRLGKFHLVSEVRVEYAYDPEREIYTRTAVVNEDRLLRPQAVYVLQTPLVESEEMACAVGRAILNRLNERFLKRPAQRQPSYAELRSEGWSTLI